MDNTAEPTHCQHANKVDMANVDKFAEGTKVLTDYIHAEMTLAQGQ
jgi:hypothetical protein